MNTSVFKFVFPQFDDSSCEPPICRVQAVGEFQLSNQSLPTESWVPAFAGMTEMGWAVRIRNYQTKDAAAVADIFNRAVSEIASAVYTPEQIAAWLGGGMEAGETHVRCSDGRAVWVATDDTDTAIAFIDLEDDGHIDMLFCQPEWTARGIASALYAELEASARQRGMPRLYVEASEIAKPFFAHKGFAFLHRNDFTMDGVAVHNYAMEKRL